WMIIAMSYGKVDHDRFGLLVALAVLPTCGPARHGDPTPTRKGGWALRLVQLGVVATYFLASWAKLRFGGIGWLTSATLQRAIIRRGTIITHPLAAHPWMLVASQFGIVAFELASPVVFLVRPRIRYAVVACFYAFHLMVFATITISFAPHQAAMSSFLPLEKVRPVEWVRARRRRRVAAGVPGPRGEPAVAPSVLAEGTET
ncbi:MAG TPA: HTTM domain-containing protein, partial [Rugosimonospora sp.]|nr:HTTM domain-containing protein [Rugosimonospora sp.]